MHFLLLDTLYFGDFNDEGEPHGYGTMYLESLKKSSPSVLIGIDGLPVFLWLHV